jgi:hypothetical protein
MIADKSLKVEFLLILTVGLMKFGRISFIVYSSMGMLIFSDSGKGSILSFSAVVENFLLK